MAVNTPERELVTVTIPAEHLAAFRAAVVREVQRDAEWVNGQEDGIVTALDSGRDDLAGSRRVDRDGALRSLRQTVDLLGQLPDGDEEASVSTAHVTLWHALEEMGRGVTERIRQLYAFGPAELELVPMLLEQLQWTTEQAQIVSSGYSDGR